MMDDTILPDQTIAFKSLPLRITYKELDYTIHILQKAIDSQTKEIRILLDGIVQTLIREEGHWRFAGTGENDAFAQAIWNAVSLRYRL
jgi:hypothetical protein